MAARKKKPVKENVRLFSSDVPKGYQVIQRADFAPVFFFKKKKDKIEGTVVEVKEVTLKKSKKTEKKTSRILTLETDKGLQAIWESAGLTSLFDEVENGDEVFIQYVADIDVGQALPMRQFVTAIKE